MGTRIRAHQIPARLATGAFILHSGLGKWNAGEEQAKGLHQMAAQAYPAFRRIPPERFARLLAAGEITLGTALLVPLVPTAVAAAGLTAFGAGLLGLYYRVPGMREPGSIRPTQQGIAVAKDSWLVGIGLTLLGDSLSDAAQRRRG
jgi:uncharacterized membrane protein YphA (DoxX/SURF4 family)